METIVQRLTPQQLKAYRLTHVCARDLIQILKCSRRTAYRLISSVQPWQRTVIISNGRRRTYVQRAQVLHQHSIRRRAGNPHCTYYDEHQVRAGRARQGGSYYD